MYEGRLSQRQFQGWVTNRLAYQRVVPRKDAAILSNCPDPDVRREWIQRIIDHDGTAPGTGGIELWIQLGINLGVPREEMEDERHVLPAVRLICESYVTFCRTKPWVQAVRVSLTELFAPRSIRSASRLFPDTTRGFRPRPRLLQESAGAGAERREARSRDRAAHCTTVETQRQAFEALAFKLDMLWAMIDTIHNAYREE